MVVIEEEKKILKRIKNGNKEAFGEFYDFYAPKVYRFVRLKVNSQETAQDLTSEAFLKIWQHLQEQKKIRERFQSLLYKIVRNLIIDFYRSKSVREILVEDSLEELSDVEDGETGEHLILRQEEMANAKKAILKINSNYQDVILWYYIDELSITDIAEILNKNEGTVRVLIHRAVRALRSIMEEK